MTVKKRKTHSSRFKAKVALAAARGDLTTSQLCSEFGVAQTQVFKWKKQLQDNAAALFEPNFKASPRDENTLAEPFFKEIGRLAMENAFLKKKCLR